MEAYKAVEQLKNEKNSLHGGDIYRNRVELDFSVNINPFGVPQRVKEALHLAAEQCEQYPDPCSRALYHAIAGMHRIAEERLVCGNGASELFTAILQAMRPKRVLIPVPSFYGYEHAAEAAGAEIVFYEMKECDGFVLTEDFLSALTKEVDLVFLANPNNPVGNLIEPQLLCTIAKVCRRQNITLVLDECFLPFSGEEETASFLRQSGEYPNVIVVRAFTKLFAIPGVRLGYLACQDAGTAARIRSVLPEWNLSVFAQQAGIAACKEDTYVRESEAFVVREREWLAGELKKLGIRVFPSKADFLLLYTRHPLAKELLAERILIRDCSNFRGLSEGYYRVAVKKREENMRLLDAVAKACGAKDANVRKQSVGAQEAAAASRHMSEEEASSKMPEIEYVLPGEIEQRSFAIIGEELRQRQISLSETEAMVTKRVIHTSADFSYAETMTFSKDAVQIAKELIKSGADIVTDTNMALAGINKRVLARYGGTAHCFMADEETAKRAKERGVTRATVSMERAAEIKKPVIYAVGNAPTALISIYEMIGNGYRPAFIIGVPVGFVNVEAAKELILKTDIPHIVNRGRKGGSNVAAAICNAILYELGREG